MPTIGQLVIGLPSLSATLAPTSGTPRLNVSFITKNLDGPEIRVLQSAPGLVTAR